MNVITERKPFFVRDAVSYLEIIDVKTGSVRTLAEFDHCVEAPNWTLDGKRLIFNDRGRINSYEMDTGAITVIDTGFCNRCNNDHVLSPDGTMIGVSHHTVEDGQSRVYVIPFNTGVPALATPIAPSYLHGWSPDGGTLTYCAERNGEYDVYTIPVGGGEEVQLTFEPGLSDGPEYTPDGRYIWFNSVRGGLMQLYRMKADGSEQTRMTWDGRNNWFAHPSPDGRTIAYISYLASEVKPGDHPANKHVEIRLMPTEGGEPMTLAALFGGQGTLNVNSWAPDSRRLAFVRYKEE
ncbi:MAG: hypothetical protein LBB86_02290 [Oscillospiraceae bacterium]|jgi:Tol biopolymer transport system component|nr:hypothetical protein [Oscillospiraceae bacterium]